MGCIQGTKEWSHYFLIGYFFFWRKIPARYRALGNWVLRGFWRRGSWRDVYTEKGHHGVEGALHKLYMYCSAQTWSLWIWHSWGSGLCLRRHWWWSISYRTVSGNAWGNFLLSPGQIINDSESSYHWVTYLLWPRHCAKCFMCFYISVKRQKRLIRLKWIAEKCKF